MPSYHCTVTVPKNTTAASPYSVTFNVSNGKVVRWEVDIPPGHAYLTGLQVYYNYGVIVPFGNNAEWLSGDDENIVYIDDLNLASHSSPQLVFKGYNLDTVNDHTFRVRISILSNC